MSQKKNGSSVVPGVQEFQFPVKDEKTTCMQMFYNRKEGTYFGRTPKSWAQLWLFYLVFYIVLAGLFTICLQGLFSTLNDREPKWKLTESLIGVNPGLGFRPLSEETERGSVIQFDTKKPKEGQYWISLLNKFFEQYNVAGKRQKYCTFNQTHAEQEVCIVDTKSFGPCSENESFGYKNARPCVFLKLNKIFGWVPQYYDNPNELPENMPAKLKQHITSLPQLERQQIWVTCNGQHPIDKENIGGIKYYPQQGFPAFYYPYVNQPGYMSPLIAVQFEKLAINEMVNVECRAWAKNIVYNGSIRDRQGSISFQLLVD